MTKNRALSRGRWPRFQMLAVLGALACAGALAPADAAGARSQWRDKYAFHNVTNESGVAQRTRTWGSSWVDYDDDGDADVFVNRHWRRPRMFVKQETGYVRLRGQTDLTDVVVDRHQCAWGEANQDWAPDLYCVQGADRGKGSGPNQLLINEGGNLVDRAPAFGVTNSLGRGRTTNWIDFDLDGDLDLFVGNTERANRPNIMYERIAAGFKRSRVGLGWEMATVGSSWSDWDRDGDPDLLVLQHSPKNAVAFVNDGGRFRRGFIRHVSGRHWLSAAWGDYDGDGWTDLHLVNKRRSMILRNDHGFFRIRHDLELHQGRMSVWLDADNDADLDAFVVQGTRGVYRTPGLINRPDFLIVRHPMKFVRIRDDSFRGPRGGNADAVSAADHDRDGDVDVLVTNGFDQWRGPNQLLENVTAGGNWAGLVLRNTAANPFGYGARVYVETMRFAYWREVTDGVNFRSQSEVGYVHLGLRATTEARIEITWEPGVRDCFEVAAGTVTRVERGSAPCPDQP